MPLDPQAKAFLDYLAASGAPPRHLLPLEEARRQQDANAPLLNGPLASIAHIEDRVFPGPDGEIGIRIYTPAGAGPFGALVYFHGGGWVWASVSSHDGICRTLASAADCVVVSVEYSRAPEHKFPRAAEDCYAATLWVAQHAVALKVDPGRIAVGGDSAGGNLAAAVTLMARDRGGQPHLVYQLLVYPVMDYYKPGTPSYTQNAEGYFLTREIMAFFWDAYLTDPSQATHPYAAPLQAQDLSGLPPALVITAEFDPLRDEGEHYAARLQEAGVHTKLHRYDGAIHGFFSMAGIIEQGHQARLEAAQALKEVFYHK